ncbi:META domain-containing protein, partial [Campylobacter sp. TTU-622]
SFDILPQNAILKIEKIVVNDKTFIPKNTEEDPNISFDNNKFYGYSGCNRFFGAYQSDGKILTVEGDRVASTQMYCHPQEVMDFENTFLSNFKGKFKILNENGKLNLSNENGSMKIFFK